MQATEQHTPTDAISGWVRRWASLLPGGEVLDLACGSGRHARHLVTMGHPVIALDHDPEMLEKAAGAGITTSLVDLDSSQLAHARPYSVRFKVNTKLRELAQFRLSTPFQP